MGRDTTQQTLKATALTDTRSQTPAHDTHPQTPSSDKTNTFRGNKNNLAWVRPDGPYGDQQVEVLRVPRSEDHQTPKVLSVPPSWMNWRKTGEELAEVEDFMLMNGHGITEEEKAILADINNNTLMEILSGEGRDYAILEMDSKDLDNFEDLCNMKEARHALLARSPQGAGSYLQPQAHGLPREWSDFGTMECVRDEECIKKLPERRKWATDSSELDVNHRIMVEATILNKGANFDNAATEYGKVYINKKFTKYLPNIGGKVMMVVGMKGCAASHPWTCYRTC